MAIMKLLVGLGNPGPKYQQNRHNIGFLQIEKIAETYDFSPWKNKFQAVCSEGLIAQQRVLLLKPQTFMNLSGQSVTEAAKFFKVPVEDIVVIHDELDLASGQLKMKQSGGAAGHNGLRSISQHLGENYRRLRFGIGHPGDKAKVHNWVLGDFSKQELNELVPIMQAVSAEARHLFDAQLSKFTSQFAQRIKPNHPEKKLKRDPKKISEKIENLKTPDSPFAILKNLRTPK